MKTDLTIIILNFNSQYWLKKTLQSLFKEYIARTKLSVKVVVVDNASSDESVAMVKQEFKKVELIARDTNDGFAAGNNIALKQVNSRYVMLLNSDMELTPESDFDQLVAYMDEHATVGVITPKVLLSSGRLDLASHRGEPTLWASFTYLSGLEKLFPQSKWLGQYHQLYKDLDSVHEIDACTGAAMVVRTSAMKKVGLLDEQFFMYAEDLDWCRRFRDAGYSIVFYPLVSVIHHKNKSGISSSSQHISAKTKGWFYDTMLQYYDKHYRNVYPTWVRKMVYYVIQIKKGAL